MRCILSFNFGSGALYLRFEECYEGKIRHVCSYSRHKHKLFILSQLSDFMTCSERFNIWRERDAYLSFETLQEDKIKNNPSSDTHKWILSDFKL